MSGNFLLAFSCPHCEQEDIHFSFDDVAKALTCAFCSATYVFDYSLQELIQQFVSLMLEVQKSSSILGSAAVSVSVKDHVVEVPFQLLFSRFPVVLNLNVDGKKIVIRFIFDALKNKVLHQDDSQVVRHEAVSSL